VQVLGLKHEGGGLMKKYIFPKDFLWGSSTSAFQVEGNCKNHDFYRWAVLGKVRDNTNPNDAVLHYEKYREDIELLKAMNHNAVRIGLEWARIEPSDGTFNENALEHYRNELKAMKDEGIYTMITLHHFASPLWFADMGSFEKQGSIKYFLRYVEHTTNSLGDLIDFYITINEPTILAYKSYFLGEFPPGKNNLILMKRVNKNLAIAHALSYDLIHRIHEKNGWNKARIGVAKHIRTFDPCNPKSLLDRFSAAYVDKLMNYEFFDIAEKAANTSGNGKILDFFGVNYYSGDLIKFPFKTLCRRELKKNKLGWDIYPEGFYRVLMQVWNRYKLPIYVTENGTCDEEDELRTDYIREHVKAMHRAIEDGADVR